MIGEFSNVKIQGMSVAVPKYVEDNMNFVSVLGERRTKKQIKLTGIAKRHISGTYQRTSDLCYAAALPLIEKLRWEKEEIKVLIYITQGPNYEIPSTAFFLQHRLGLSKDCVVFDINLGCSSFNAGVHVVSALMQSCNVSDKALLLIGDTAGKVLKPEDEMTPDVIADKMIFGAAGAAIALEKVENSALKFFTKSDGNGFEAIIRRYKRPTTMNGEAVFEFAINDVAEDVNQFRKHFMIEEDDVDFYVFHQAQKLILDNLAATCDIPDGKELRSLEEYGNTSGTSVPVSVCANRDKFAEKDSVKLLLCGFGVGLSWGAIYSEIPTDNILPIIETDEHYDEDKKPADGLHDKYILVMDSDKIIGEYICRYVEKKSARLVMSGTNVEKMQSMQEDYLIDSHVVPTQNASQLMQDIIKYCKEKEIVLSGIVFPNDKFEKEWFQESINMLTEEDVLATKASIVVLSDLETKKQENPEEYFVQKAILEKKLMSGIEVLGEKMRVNAVLYDANKMCWTQISGNGQAWIEEYLRSNCDENMKRPLYVGKAVAHLLSDDSIYSRGSVIPINM